MNLKFIAALSLLAFLAYLALKAKLLTAKAHKEIAANDPESGWRHALLAAESRLVKWKLEAGPRSIAGWKGEAKRIRSLFETITTLHPAVAGAQGDPAAVTAAWGAAISAGNFNRKLRRAATTQAEEYLAANRARFANDFPLGTPAEYRQPTLPTPFS
ncbi:MAG TPA: hypothetical protein VH988_31260 [Thermoanaerobaculia bacterium]|jgi:hypothetical protein|nr:hypothetical protein [Thermoanaerobaculia bacterium]